MAEDDLDWESGCSASRGRPRTKFIGEMAGRGLREGETRKTGISGFLLCQDEGTLSWNTTSGISK